MLITIAGDVEVSEGQPAPAEITFSLPAGVTTDYPITITLTPGSATPAVDAADIAGGIPTSVTIPASGSSVTLQITALADAVIEPVEKLFLVPTAGSFTFSNNVMLDVKDEHHSGTITFSSDRAKITEGVETATITVSLPGALVAGSNIQVDIQKGASTAGNTDHSLLPAFVTIEAGKHDAVFTVTAPADLVLEDDETLALEGTAPGYSVAGTSILIGDATSLDPLNKVLRLTPVDADIAEGNTGDFAVRLPAGVTSGKNITVQLAKTAGASTAADTDHTQIPVSVTIPAGQNASDDFDISAVPDLIIEPAEKLRVDGVAPAGFTFEGTDIYITDATGLNPANMQIRILPDSTILHEGSTSKVVFALPAGVTSATDIAINVTADGTLAAQQADYSLTPASIMLPKEQNTVTVILEALQDHLQEPTEQLRLTGTAVGYTVVPSHAITIPGDPAPHLTIAASKTADATEPAGNGAFHIQLSAAAPADVTVTYAVSGTATAGSDYEMLSGQTVVKAGDTEVNIPVTVKDDDVVEGPEDVVITLQSAVFSFLGNTVNCTIGAATAAVQIADNDQVTLIIEKIADAAEPSTAGSVKIRFTNPQASSTVPVTVQYSVAGTAIPGTDYVALPGSVVIPAGSSEVTVPVQAVDDALLDGTKTVIIQLTSADGALPGVTWPIGTPAEASVNVYDNDVVSMEIFGLNQVAEGATVPVTLKSSQAIATDIPVSIQLQHDAARTVSTNVPRSGDVLTVVMPANQTEVTFNITVDENDINDDNGYVNLVIQPFSGNGQAYGKGASGNTATVVTDNDALQISFRKDTVRIPEGNSGQAMMVFSLQLSRMSSRAIQVQYEFADAFEGAGADKDPQRAKAGDDFLASPTSITIPPMQAEADITVAVNGDTRQEADKYFALKLTNITVSGGVNTPAPGALRTAVGVIENDDQDVDLEIRAHKGVSPNGDGKNDVWIIENIEKYSRNEVVIVNRWGGTIFKTSNYNNTSNNFSGIANIGSGTGKELPDGSYFYILQVWGSDGKVTRYNGYIVIKNGL
jgi:gliding motility-associated-like protein